MTHPKRLPVWCTSALAGGVFIAAAYAAEPAGANLCTEKDVTLAEIKDRTVNDYLQELVGGREQFSYVLVVGSDCNIALLSAMDLPVEPLFPLEGARVLGSQTFEFLFFEASPGCTGATHGGSGTQVCPPPP